MATAFEPLEGKYEILEKIREGGMGSVYKVRHRLLDELRVVKVMRPQLAEDEVLRERFLREAKLAIRLHHQNLAQIYDFTIDESGYAYLVMEFIDGFNLQEVIKVLGRPALGVMLEIADQSLDAISYLHRKRIIHRDISPDNLLVTRDEDRNLKVKLIDLGIAKDREVEDSLTSAGTFLGKVRYSSPEHFRTHEGAQVGVRSDLYSFGVVLYEMLTGTYPIRGSSVASLISGHLMHPPIDFGESDANGAVPDGLRKIVMRALAKQADERFATAADFRAALAPFRNQCPIEDEQLQAVFEIPTLTTRRIRILKPGSTQDRMNRSFGLGTTPPPSGIDGLDDQIENTASIIRAQLESEEADEAERSLKVAVKLYGDQDIFVELRGRLEELRARRRAEDADAFRGRARALMENSEFAAAIEMLEQARWISPASSENCELLAAAREGLRLEEEARLRRSAIHETALRADRLILAGRFQSAIKVIDAAIHELGDFDQAKELRSRAETEEKKCLAQENGVRECLDRALALSADDRFADAEDALERADQLSRDLPEMGDLVSEARAEVQRRIEAHRRSIAIDKVIESIERQLAKSAVAEARRELGVARRLYGSTDAFDDLAAAIEACERELRHTELEGGLRKALEQERPLTSTIVDLEAASALDPHNERLHRLLAEARIAHRRFRDEEIAHRAEEALGEIDRLISAGEVLMALRALDGTVAEVGDFRLARRLRRRLADRS
jgi:serine/threonine protein kinase